MNLERVPAFFRPPVLETEERTRRAFFYFWIQWTNILAGTVVLTALAVALPHQAPLLLGILLAVLGPAFAGLALVRRGYLALASAVLVFMLWSVITGAAASQEGIRDGGVMFFVVVVFIAGLTFGARGGVLAAVICILTDVGLVAGEAAGLVQGGPGSSGELLAIQIGVLVSFASLQSLALGTLHGALRRRRDEISRREQVEAKLRRHEEQLEHTVEERTAELRKLNTAVHAAPISFFVTDRDGVFEYVNPKFEQTTGYSLADLVGKTPRVLKSGAHGVETYRDLWRTVLAGGEWHADIQNRTRDGALVWEYSSVSPVVDDEGEITHFVAAKEDITELKQLQDELAHQAHYDRLTGLPNRVLFFDRLQQSLALARRHERSLAVLFIDLDGFKAVNDTFGHDIGDALLQGVSERMKGCVRETDVVARMGGDEFTILLTDLEGSDDPAEVARRLLQSLSPPFELDGNTCEVGACIGIAVYPVHGGDEDALMASADQAMYEVKRSGKNNFRFAGGDAP